MATTVKELIRQCRDIADELTRGVKDPTQWLDDALDYNFIVSSDRQYLGARVLVSFGGPTIWVDFHAGYVEGYWGADSYTTSFNDTSLINECLQDFYEAAA